MAERTLGDVATKVLFENDRVRVWEMRLAPGEDSPVHRHDLDYLLVQIDGERIDLLRPLIADPKDARRRRAAEQGATPGRKRQSAQ